MRTFLLKKIKETKHKQYDIIFLYCLIFTVEFLFFNIYTLFLSLLIISTYITYKLDKRKITFLYITGTNTIVFYLIIIFFNLYQVNNFDEKHLLYKKSQMFFKENYYITEKKDLFIKKDNKNVLIKKLNLKNNEDSDFYIKYVSNKDLNLIIEKRTYKFNFGFYLREQTFLNLI